MVRELAALAALLALGACVSFSTAPEAANPAVQSLCYVRQGSGWTQIQPPENAQAYRDAWTRAAETRPFMSAYTSPRWPAQEFWFRNASDVTRLCTGKPFHHQERCATGTTTDFTEGNDGVVVSDHNEPACL